MFSVRSKQYALARACALEDECDLILETIKDESKDLARAKAICEESWKRLAMTPSSLRTAKEQPNPSAEGPGSRFRRGCQAILAAAQSKCMTRGDQQFA